MYNKVRRLVSKRPYFGLYQSGDALNRGAQIQPYDYFQYIRKGKQQVQREKVIVKKKSVMQGELIKNAAGRICPPHALRLM